MQTSRRLSSVMGPAIVAARRRGVLSPRIDDHVVRIVVSYLASRWSGYDVPTPDEWVVRYLDIDGMMEEIIEESQNLPPEMRFSPKHAEKKIEELMRLYQQDRR